MVSIWWTVSIVRRNITFDIVEDILEFSISYLLRDGFENSSQMLTKSSVRRGRIGRGYGSCCTLFGVLFFECISL
ncbi:ORF929 [White spot syndrome virus]|uniref:ORF929 n=1 Tax=White spot syndrome virus TaxID=342409 RepID=A0A2D3I6B2_9VIRU|nr:ORF929 [White spot syndrome virus]